VLKFQEVSNIITTEPFAFIIRKKFLPSLPEYFFKICNDIRLKKNLSSAVSG